MQHVVERRWNSRETRVTAGIYGLTFWNLIKMAKILKTTSLSASERIILPFDLNFIEVLFPEVKWAESALVQVATKQACSHCQKQRALISMTHCVYMRHMSVSFKIRGILTQSAIATTAKCRWLWTAIEFFTCYRTLDSVDLRQIMQFISSFHFKMHIAILYI